MATYVYSPTRALEFESLGANLDLPIVSVKMDTELAGGATAPNYVYIETSKDLDVDQKEDLDQAMLDRGYTFVK